MSDHRSAWAEGMCHRMQDRRIDINGRRGMENDPLYRALLDWQRPWLIELEKLLGPGQQRLLPWPTNADRNTWPHNPRKGQNDDRPD